MSYYTFSSIPNDITLKIVSSLKVRDIASLSCCSRVWREICGSDCLWKPLFKAKWPLLYESVARYPNVKGWRAIYMKQHKKMKVEANPRRISFRHPNINWPDGCDFAEGITEVLKALTELNDPRKPFKCSKSM